MQRSRDGVPASPSRWDPRAYARNAAFVPELGRPLLDLLDPRHGKFVSDFGCRTVVLSSELDARGTTVGGVDADEAVVEEVRRRGVDARRADARNLRFDAEFDAIFSNAAVHSMRRDPDAVLAGAFGALRPGDRFVGEMGRFGNVASIRDALGAVLRGHGVDPVSVDPWYFPGVREYEGRLALAGFAIDRLELFARPTPLSTGIRGWVECSGPPHILRLPPRSRSAAVREVQRLLKPALFDPLVGWLADYVRLRFVARRPGPPGARRPTRGRGTSRVRLRGRGRGRSGGRGRPPRVS